MIEKCLVKVISNKVICDSVSDTKKYEKHEKDKMNEMIKNKKKLSHLEGIGMDISKYHPTIIRTMIDGGRNFKIPENLKNQLISFANEAYTKGFNPSLFGYNTTLHKFIKTVHKIPKRKYVKKGGNIAVKSSSESSSESSSQSETDLDGILSDVENDLKGGNIKGVKDKMKQYKHRIPKAYYSKIMKNI